MAVPCFCHLFYQLGHSPARLLDQSALLPETLLHNMQLVDLDEGAGEVVAASPRMYQFFPRTLLPGWRFHKSTLNPLAHRCAGIECHLLAVVLRPLERQAAKGSGLD